MFVDAMLTLPKKSQKARRDVAEYRNSETYKMFAEAGAHKCKKTLLKAKPANICNAC